MSDKVDVSEDEESLVKHMNYAAYINIGVGILTVIGCLLVPILRGFILPGLISIGLGVYYLNRTMKSKAKAWDHLDIMAVLVIVNFFFGAFVPSVFIGLAMKDRHAINVKNGKAY